MAATPHPGDRPTDDSATGDPGVHGAAAPGNFIQDIVDDDIVSGRTPAHRVTTRFPPEPNGFLHLGHAYAASVSFRIARRVGGTFHLRFDDTNPTKEELAYTEVQMRDLRWLGIEWGERLFYASDYFDKMLEYAVELIRKGRAYVCRLSMEEIREYRGTFTEPGRDSPYRDRSIAENLDLFARMQTGEFKEGEAVLRAKIDMAAQNPLLRDPVMYRIYDTEHYRAGRRWRIYPMYDWAHCLEDSIEGVTHSLCGIEFDNNRALYDWYLDQLDVPAPRPKQIEFSQFALSYTILGKRKLIQLVEEAYVSGWDDPRMPTLAGLRRRGFPPDAIQAFLAGLGVTKVPMSVDITLLEYHVRQHLNRHSRRVMAVLRPLRLVIDNYPEGREEWLPSENNPEDASMGTRDVPFSKVLYIERDDFTEKPPKGYFRMSPGAEVRLKNAYFVRCDRAVHDPATGEVVEIHGTYDPETRGGQAPPDGRRVRGTLHWVSAAHAIQAEVHLINPLFTCEHPQDLPPEQSFLDHLRPDSREILAGCQLEPSVADAQPGVAYQFMRHGYFCRDAPVPASGAPAASRAGGRIFNRTVSLKDSWSRKGAGRPD
jgi:glutaminyl-tRNA synthetase